MCVCVCVCVCCSEFLQKNAPSEVNLSATAMDEVHKDLKNPSRYSFTVAKVRFELFI